jgi:hypothetical protein
MGAEMSKTAWILVLAALVPSVAGAQPLPGQDVAGRPSVGPTTYNVRTMSYSMWCQETQRYESDRCEERRPADVKEFETYRATIERYELQFLKQQQEEYSLNARNARDPSSTVRAKETTPLR